ncbi:(Na+)-NQR maturation NqrM [Marinospirillum minutulum]|uniref:(Na+)-NQR maturation NqrM n=1 Tax=Marinospirillum minutulum TaxID=64974 RepID=UPI00048091A4|nr:(Na+)-NQR maturation NqrM [Marinospirillum minutulum]
MQIFLLSALVLGVIMLIMSVGVIMGRKPIAGSCGGMSALGMDTACDICGGDQTVCETESQKRLAYDAAAK